MLEGHDRHRVRVHAYDIGHNDGSACRRRLLAACDDVTDCRALSDAEAAARIAADGIDVLVDLAGHTVGARPGILARRPAPVQVCWLGYPATTGAPWIDYFIADPVALPPELRAHFSEAIAYLPHCYLPADDRQAIAPGGRNRAADGLPEDRVVLAAFHQPYKLEPELFAAWLEILRRAPDAVLWLRAREEAMRTNLRAEAVRQGIDPARLVFSSRQYPKSEYLARLGQADLFLDTRWFNGHSSVSDALWAGVPVVTCPGDAFAGRVATSILTAAGLPDLAAPDLPAYVELAARLATSPWLRTELRQRLQEARQLSAFFSPARFTAGLETAFETMAARHRAGLVPADFTVAAGVPVAAAA